MLWRGCVGWWDECGGGDMVGGIGVTYSKIEHAGLLRSAEVLALCYFGVRVQLQ
jgi:hypothetical protein